MATAEIDSGLNLWLGGDEEDLTVIEMSSGYKKEIYVVSLK